MTVPTDSVAPAHPTGSSNPWPLWQWFKKITDWIAALSPSGADKYDTGWVNLTLENGWTVAGGLTPRVRRIGSIVHMEGRVQGGSSFAATLPAQFRPSQSQHFIVRDGTTTNSAPLAVSNNGNISPSGVLSQPNLFVTWFVG